MYQMSDGPEKDAAMGQLDVMREELAARQDAVWMQAQNEEGMVQVCAGGEPPICADGSAAWWYTVDDGESGYGGAGSGGGSGSGAGGYGGYGSECSAHCPERCGECDSLCDS